MSVCSGFVVFPSNQCLLGSWQLVASKSLILTGKVESSMKSVPNQTCTSIYCGVPLANKGAAGDKKLKKTKDEKKGGGKSTTAKHDFTHLKTFIVIIIKAL